MTLTRPALLLMMIFISQCLFAQPAPPILRNPFTTNSHFGPVPTEGQVPIWNDTAKKWSNNIISGGASTPHTWTNDNGTLKPIAFPTNILLRVNVPDDGTGTNFYFDSRVYRTNAASKLFAIYNGGSNALTIGPNGQLMAGRGNATPLPGAVLYGIFDTALGETNQQEIFTMSGNSAVGYSGAADMIIDTNYGALILFANKEGGTKFTRFSIQAGGGLNPQDFNTFTMQGLMDGATYFQVDPNFTLASPTNYLFSSSVRITNTHTLMSLQNSNFPVLEVDGVGDLRLIKKVPYLWPSSQGAAGTVLTNDGAGTLGWGPGGAGGPAFGDLVWTNDTGEIYIVVDRPRITFATNRILGRLIRADGTNTVLGSNAGFRGTKNTAVGQDALSKVTSDENVAIGHRAAISNSSGGFNVVVGSSAMEFNEFRSDNTAVGWNSLHTFSAGFENTAIGSGTMDQLVTSFSGTALGWGALDKLEGQGNVALGAYALLSATGGGNHNLAAGFSSMELSDRLEGNVALGRDTLRGIDDLTNVIAIGYQATALTGGKTNAVGIGALTRITADNQMMLGTNITHYVFRNVGYGFPSAQGASSTALTNDGSGNLGWWPITISSGGTLTTNENQFLGVPLSIKDEAFVTNLNVQSSLQVSNGHTYLAGPVTNLTQLNLPHLTVSRSAIINAQGDVTNSSADSNWSLYSTNVWNDRQFGSQNLTNLSGTGAITNVFSASLSNATMKPVVFPSANNFATNYTGQFFGLEAGGNVTLTPNGSNIVIAASVSGSGISTNGNQFGPSVEVTIKDGALLTNTMLHGGTIMTNSDSQITVLRVDSTFTTNNLSVGSNGVVAIKGTTRWINMGESSDPGAVGIEIGAASPAMPSIARSGLFSGGGNLSLGYNSSAGGLFVTANANYKMSIGAGGSDGFLGLGMTTETPSALLSVGPGSAFQVDADGDVRTRQSVIITNVPGSFEPLLRLVQTNGRGYSEFTTTNSVIATNRFVLSPGSNTVSAGQIFGKIHSTTISGGINTIVLTNDADAGQGASATLTNLSGTGAITNLFSQTLSNATIKPLVVGVGDAAGATNTTGEIRGLEAGANITLTPNGSNYVIASTASGSGDSLWSSNSGTFYLTAYPTNVIFAPTNAGPAVAGPTATERNLTNFVFRTTERRIGGTNKLFQIWNGDASAFTVSDQGIMIGSTNYIPVPQGAIDIAYDTAFGVDTPGKSILLSSYHSTVGYSGNTTMDVSTNKGALSLIANKEGNGFVQFQATAGDGAYTNFDMYVLVQDAANTIIFPYRIDPDFSMTPTGYVFGSTIRITNTHMLMSLQNSNFPVFEVDGVGDIRTIKKIAYTWPSAQGAAQTVLTNDGSGNLGWGAVAASGGGLSTNADQFGASVTLTIKEGALLTNTLFYPSNLTGPAVIQLASVGQMTNTTEWRGTNGVIGLAISSNGLALVNQRLDLANSIGFRTNNIDFRLNTYQAFTNSLKTNLVLQLTNTLEGVTTRLDAYGNGRLGGGLTNAWQLLFTVAAGTTIYWPPGTTNGNYDVLVNSNQVVSFTFLGGLGSTNILASYRVLEGTGAN